MSIILYEALRLFVNQKLLMLCWCSKKLNFNCQNLHMTNIYTNQRYRKDNDKLTDHHAITSIFEQYTCLTKGSLIKTFRHMYVHVHVHV